MKRNRRLTALLGSGLLAVLLLVLSGPVQAAKEKYFDRSGRLIVEEKPAADLLRPYQAGNREPEKTFPVPAPPFSEGIYPCSDCHGEMETNPQRRELEDMHTDIVLNHAEGQRWCLDCHNPDDRDVLRLVSGETIPFDQSYRLCGQCHGDKFRDWKVGIHGKRTGYWNGDKQYLLCAHCHNPHDPAFKAMKPLPPPVRPGEARH